jgi:hypothetical protein
MQVLKSSSRSRIFSERNRVVLAFKHPLIQVCFGVAKIQYILQEVDMGSRKNIGLAAEFSRAEITEHADVKELIKTCIHCNIFKNDELHYIEIVQN